MPVPPVFAIDGARRDYAWGSHTAIQQLLGEDPDARPLAELWFGAHADDPSPTGVGARLDELIATDPGALLGPAVMAEYGPRLPFLVKLLAAEKALSMQVHPTRAQAEAGFDREEAAGVARSAPTRTYRDRNHKPELICALTAFDALCGFRPPDVTLQLLNGLDLAELRPLRELLAGPDGLRAAFTMLLEHPDPAPLVDAVTACARASDDDELRAARVLADDFPGDVGIVLSLLLNQVRLEPGEAIFLGAGNVHCYLRGLGVEIMANSDNVLRCALTPKHVDVAEVLAVTDFRPLIQPRVGVVEVAPDVWRYRTPVRDFCLDRMDLSAHDAASGESMDFATSGPSIVLATEHPAHVFSGGASVEIAPGHAAFVAPSEFVVVQGRGDVFKAGIPD